MLEHVGPREDGNGRSLARAPLRVLIVDDDRDAVVTLTALLRDEGYETQAAYSAEGLWAAIRRFDPRAILLDIGLPDRNGYDLARELRQRFGERMVLVAVTAWTKKSDQMLAQMAGFDHHLGKPYDPQALLALLKPLSEGNAADC